MIINKEGKLFGKISIVDILVVIFIAVAAFGIYTKFFTENERVTVADETIEYQFSVKGVREGTFEGLSKLGPVYDTTTKEYMGEIVGVEKAQTKAERVMGDGSVINAEIPERLDLTVTVRVDGSSNNSGYYTKNNLLLCVGSKFVIGSKYVKTTGEICSIKDTKK